MNNGMAIPPTTFARAVALNSEMMTIREQRLQVVSTSIENSGLPQVASGLIPLNDQQVGKSRGS
jgi:hypothetical protein